MAIYDDLVGLRFEIGGGFGKTAGRIVGKAGDLYLVERDGDSHMELASIDDLVTAKFHPDPDAAVQAVAAGNKPVATRGGKVPLRDRVMRRSDDDLP